MPEIRCNVTNCSHNNNSICFSNVVNVGGTNAKKDCDTCCASFLDEALYGSLTNNVNNPGSPCNSITCEANTCVYNHNEYCTAPSIEVNGNSVHIYTETNCKTFRK